MDDQIAGLESMVVNPQSHTESQQEQIRVAELMLQQMRTTGTPDELVFAYSWCFCETSD